MGGDFVNRVFNKNKPATLPDAGGLDHHMALSQVERIALAFIYHLDPAGEAKYHLELHLRAASHVGQCRVNVTCVCHAGVGYHDLRGNLAKLSAFAIN
jgi:hypothetical protein